VSLDPLLIFLLHRLSYLDPAPLPDLVSLQLAQQFDVSDFTWISLSTVEIPARNSRGSRAPRPCKLCHQGRLDLLLLWYEHCFPESTRARRPPPCSAQHSPGPNLQSYFNTAAGRIRGRRFTIVFATSN
jgi:hypothetical protein